MVQVPENPIMDARVQARRQQELNGFTEKYSDILDQRAQKFGKEILPAWQRVGTYLDGAVDQLYKKYSNPDGTLDEKKLYELERLRLLKQHSQGLENALKGQAEKLESNLAYQYTDAFYFHAFGAEQTAKVALNVPVLSHSQVMGTVNNPWLPDGFTYSDRLRANTKGLALKMKDIIEESVSTGASAQETARMIQARTGESYNNALRLARTELNRAAALGASHSFMQNADILDGKRYNATLDARTSPKCSHIDGKLYQLEYDTPEMPGNPGERIPNHPNCRCKWTPVLSALGVSKQERIGRGAGDSKTNFGERMYTKARNYEEYAKEVGLPSMEDRLRNDSAKSYLRRGETIADYRDAVGMTESAFAKTLTYASLIADAGSAAANIFTPATSIAAANSWAAANIPQVATVDYKGYDLQLANEVNEELYNLFQAYPEVEDINYIGTAQQRNKDWYERKVQEYAEALNAGKHGDTWKGLGVETNKKLILKHKSVKKPKSLPANTQAQAANKSWGPQAGITYNKVWTADYAKLAESTERSVRQKWHPDGTEKPVSILIHEFGHSIDYFLDSIGLRDKYITPITKDVLSMYSVEIEEQLSRYAATNHREVVAEAFAEYRLNPKPRKWAKKIGEAIEAALEEYRKGLK
jgi:SPP1 gp7 family putative phage head morphogenesis protein